MVVSFTHPDPSGHARSAARLFQQMRLQFAVEEGVRCALVDQQVGQAGAVLEQSDGILLPPGSPVIS